jgi:hypothetical protein
MPETTTTDITTEALAGPWHAVLADRYGYPIDQGDIVDYEPDELKVSIVRGSAVPIEVDGEARLPGSWLSADRIAEFDDFEEPEEVEARWVQAQAMAAGLNTAALGTLTAGEYVLLDGERARVLAVSPAGSYLFEPESGDPIDLTPGEVPGRVRKA